jgi:hypothetical protein
LLLFLVISSLILRCILFLLEKVWGKKWSWIVTYSSMERCSSFEQYNILFRWIYNVTMTCEELKGKKNWDCCVQQVFVKMWKSRISNYNMSITCVWMIMSILILVCKIKKKERQGETQFITKTEVPPTLEC